MEDGVPAQETRMDYEALKALGKLATGLKNAREVKRATTGKMGKRFITLMVC